MRGWSQEALARHLRDAAGIDLHQTAVARLERGERTIRFNEVTALAKLLGLDLHSYSAGIPQLTPEEYAEAKERLPQLVKEEWAARDTMAELSEQYDAKRREAERSVSRLKDQRKRLQAAIQAYEERRSAARARDIQPYEDGRSG